ncbi:hypothetical protein KKI24_17850 [bacterium]|nr:hypothetical protein [bacterium]
MFEYSCSGTHLANWVLSQVNDTAGAIFPKRKKWSFYIKVFYPAGSDKSALMILVANQNECVVFIPIDETIDAQQIRSILKPELIWSLRSDFKWASYQRILLTCERQHSRVLEQLDEKNTGNTVLVLSSESVYFSRGNFENPRLEYRLSQIEYDPDLIPGFFPDSRLKVEETIQKSLFYQHFFHGLNRLWLQGEKSIPLRSIVSRSVPCWSHFRRVDQKRMMELINTELETVFQRFFEGLLTLDIYRKKASSQPEVIIVFPDPPETKKIMSIWRRQQKSALEYLHGAAKQLSIDELQLSTN